MRVQPRPLARKLDFDGPASWRDEYVQSSQLQNLGTNSKDNSKEK
jgi:hypothetical protein